MLHALIRHYSAVLCRVLALAVEFILCCRVKLMYVDVLVGLIWWQV